MTPEQRESKQEYYRLYNKTPARKEAKRNYRRRQREFQQDTLHHESIAMENPKYIPEVVQPTTGVCASLGSLVSSSDWIVPDLSPSPTFILPVSTNPEDVDTSKRSPRCIRQKCHVPSGERQSLLARRNQQFESAIARRVHAAPEDNESDAAEQVKSTQPQTAAGINNNGICQYIFKLILHVNEDI